MFNIRNDGSNPNMNVTLDPLIMPYASCTRRFFAYTIDWLIIGLPVVLFSYWLTNFGQTLQQRFDSQDFLSKVEFYVRRNLIRDSSFLVYLIYCGLIEGSRLQGTIGKRLLGIKVVDEFGQKITFKRAIGRNTAKIISWIPCFLGFLSALWSKQNRGWHDMIAHTLVVRSYAQKKTHS